MNLERLKQFYMKQFNYISKQNNLIIPLKEKYVSYMNQFLTKIRHKTMETKNKIIRAEIRQTHTSHISTTLHKPCVALSEYLKHLESVRHL